jgi:UDP-N-acetylmuramoyl-L-alanyl-D-glutamate--2,6-diaminopimelate ligase
MRLAQLLADVPVGRVCGPTDRVISRVVIDPLETTRNALFVEVHPGSIGEALRRGAVAIVTARPPPRRLPASLTWISVPDPEAIVGLLCSRSRGEPSAAMQVFAVTGTNGKTTVSTLLHQLFQAAGSKAGLIGTVAIRIGDRKLPTQYTTPPPWILQDVLARMQRAGCTHVALEATSHALSTRATGHRMNGTRVQVAGFTNLTHDHLDFHGTMRDYGRTKARLFEHFAERACFNIDDPFGAKLAAKFAGPALTVSVAGAEADLRVLSATYQSDGTRATLGWRGRSLRLTTRLVGRHNLENALVTLGMAHLGGMSMPRAVRMLAKLTAPPGRLQLVWRSPNVYVDYAHTPDALQNGLATLRPLTRGKLVCVFGAGGDRDAAKRPVMGEVTSQGADVVVVTSDNPRSEDPHAIMRDIAAGATGDAVIVLEKDRRRAIERAIRSAAPDDTVLIAGKGHEKRQVFASRSIPFDDAAIALRFCRSSP